jgi:hypothetical protein
LHAIGKTDAGLTIRVVNTSKERSGYRWGGESRARTERTAEERERDASKWARWAAAVVLILGTAFIVAPAARHLGHIWENPFEPSQTVKRVVKTGAGETEVTTTTGEADRSFLERSLAAGGLLLLRIGVVAFAAFLAGAVVQRTLMGDFALKLGPLEIPQLKRAADESERALGEIQSHLKTHANATEDAMNVAADAAEGVSELAAQIDMIKEALEPWAALIDGAESEVDEGVGDDVDVGVQLEGSEGEEQE